MAAINYTFTDLKTSMLRYCGEMTDGTSPYEVDGRALDYLGKAYLDVLSGGSEFDIELGEPWPWAVEPNPGSLVLKLPFTTGSVAVTADNTTITFSNPPTFSLAGWHFQISGFQDWFKILTHTASAASATIDTPYTDVSQSAVGFMAVQLEYVIAPTNGILRMIEPMTVYRFQDWSGNEEGQIYFADRDVMLRNYPMHRLIAGTPTQFATTYRDVKTGAYTVRFNRYVSAYQCKVDYQYIKVPNTPLDDMADAPLIPVEHREVLAYVAAYKLLTDKSDSKAPEYFKLAQTKLRAMAKAAQKERTQTSIGRGQLIPRLDNYYRTRRYVVQETQ